MVVLSIFLIISAASVANVRPKPLNVLFLVVDDLRPALGCYHFPKVLSPNIDQLAKQSILFENAFVQQAVCGPSRTSFLTSRRPDTTRLYDFYSYWRTHAGNYTTLPQHFKNNGYFTYSIGKVFHPGKSSGETDDYPYSWSEPAWHPSTQKYKMEKVCPDKDGELNKMNILCAVNLTTQPEGSLPDLQSTQQSIKVIKQFQQNKTNKPFFLGVGLHKPHIPFKFPEEYLKYYPIEEIDLAPDPFSPIGMPPVARNVWKNFRKRDDVAALNLSFPYQLIPDNFHKKIRQHYFASVTYMDAQIGEILHQLEKSGYADNTIISLIGDHGWSLGEHGTWCKFSNFETVTRVPMMIHMPGVTSHTTKNKFQLLHPLQNERFIKYSKPTHTSGIRSKALVELVDLFPTLADLSGLEIPKTCPSRSFKINLCTEGHSLGQLIRTSDDSKRHKFKSAVFSQYPRPSDMPQLNSDLPHLEDIRIMGYSMRTTHHRYTEWVSFDPETFTANFTQVHASELYLHDSDPLEVYNVAGMKEYKHLQKNLREKLIAGWQNALPKFTERQT